jgi:hypothetical protein
MGGVVKDARIDVGRRCGPSARITRRWCHRAALGALIALGRVTSAHAAESEPQRPPPNANALQQYDASFVGIEATRIGGYFFSATPGHSPGYVFPSDTWEAYRGRARLKLGLLEFYEAVDRPDLRSKALTHYILQGSFGVTGFGLILGGGIYEYIHLSREPSTAPIGGWIVMGAGFACFVTAYLIGPRPIAADQAVVLANRHNARIRLQLGLPAAVDDSSERESVIPFARRAPSFPAVLGNRGLTLVLQL